MYNEKFIAAVRIGKKNLRELGPDKDTVQIPFKSEYSILLKNVNSTAALVKVYIDGENVVGSGLVIDPGEEVNLERFHNEGNMKSGRKFRFIEKTEEISDFRGDKAEDGMIRVTYQFEKEVEEEEEAPIKEVHHHHHHNNYYDFGRKPGPLDSYPTIWYGTSTDSSELTSSTVKKSYSLQNSGEITRSFFSRTTADAGEAPVAELCDLGGESSDLGITVKGSHSSQRFVAASIGELEAKEHVIVLRLSGVAQEKKSKRRSRPGRKNNAPRVVAGGNPRTSSVQKTARS